MELYLAVWTNKAGEFRIYRDIDYSNNIRSSIIVVEYNYTPWPRRGGNLLWG